MIAIPTVFDTNDDTPPATAKEQLQQVAAYENSLVQSVKGQPNDPVSLGAYADFLSCYPDRYSEALEMFERCLVCCCDKADVRGELLPQYDLVYSTYVSLYATFLSSMVTADEGNGERACTLYEKALEKSQGHPLALGDLATFLHRHKKAYREAEAAYEQHLKDHPGHASIWAKYGNFLKSVKRDMKAAARAFKTGVKVGPRNVEALTAYAVFLHGSTGDFELAETMYQRAFEADPLHVNNLSNFGLFLSECKEEFKRAETMYQKAMACDPTHANSAYNYAVLLDSGMKDQARAEEMYRKCLEANANHAFALYNLAVLVEEVRGSTDEGKREAEMLFVAAIEASPRDAVTMADYGRFKLVCLKDTKGAEELLKRSLAIDRACVVACYNLGMIELVHNKRKDEAKKLFSTALEVEGGHVESLRYMARIYVAEGKKKEAEAMLVRALENAKDERANISKELEELRRGGGGSGSGSGSAGVGRRRGSR
mmetsp:Transcript_28463/g.56918  ORF Transcript_28463/g.56918 Transcript_28463/m.56918 type:complete len:485 (+) Transcript_28463:152-1606(+)